MLYGDWDAFEGAFFPEFDPRRHITVGRIDIPEGAIRFRALDYGLDMTACLWCAACGDGSIIIYRELYESNLLLSEAAERILSATDKSERIRYTVASPDLWNRRQESGKSGFDIMSASGLRNMIKADNSRIAGWRIVREYLKSGSSYGGGPRLRISSECKNLIRCIPLLRFDERVREDAADTPHEITHAPEAMRYALMSRQPKTPKKQKNRFTASVYTFDERREEKDFEVFFGR